MGDSLDGLSVAAAVFLLLTNGDWSGGNVSLINSGLIASLEDADALLSARKLANNLAPDKGDLSGVFIGQLERPLPLPSPEDGGENAVDGTPTVDASKSTKGGNKVLLLELLDSFALP